MPDLVRAKEPRRAAFLHSRPLRGVTDRAQRVDDSTAEQPQKESCGSGVEKRSHNEHGDPPHADVQHCREPLWRVHPNHSLERSQRGERPDRNEEPHTERAAQQHQTDRRVRSGDEDVDHHVIDAAQMRDRWLGDLERVIERAGAVHRDEARAKDGEGDDLSSASVLDRDYEEDHQPDHGQHRADKVSQTVDGFAERDSPHRVGARARRCLTIVRAASSGFCSVVSTTSSGSGIFGRSNVPAASSFRYL